MVMIVSGGTCARMICMTRSETSPYFRILTSMKTAGGKPFFFAISDSRHAVDIGKAEWIPYARAA